MRCAWFHLPSRRIAVPGFWRSELRRWVGALAGGSARSGNRRPVFHYVVPFFPTSFGPFLRGMLYPFRRLLATNFFLGHEREARTFQELLGPILATTISGRQLGAG